MSSRNAGTVLYLSVFMLVAVIPATSQSFRVQCPTSTITHPSALTNVNAEPTYSAPTTLTAGANGYLVPSAHVNGAIKCQQISGGDGYATMGDGTQTYMFSFGPLSGLTDMAAGRPGTEFPSTFNVPYPGTTGGSIYLLPGDPATTDDAPTTSGAFNWNGAVGLIGDPDSTVPTPSGVTATATATVAGGIIDDVTINNPGRGYFGPATVTFDPPAGCVPTTANPCQTALGSVVISNTGATAGHVTDIDITFAGEGYLTVPGVHISAPVTGCTESINTGCVTGHVDPRPIMDVGVMNGNIPAPLMAIDEDDEFFLTLTNVGMIMRPDLFEQHTVHFHGYPNASSFYDGVPDASVAINIGGSFTYYYLAPDAGTYFWHCHITPPEHLQMGMVGQIYVRPRQDRVPSTTTLYAALQTQQLDLRTACNSAVDILCSNPLPAVNTGLSGAATVETGGKAGYAYNDGDGSTYYDVEYPLQIHGFDPNFHFVGMTFNPEGFVDMKDKYFLLNGRSYPDTVQAGPMQTESVDGRFHFSQPLPSIINIPVGKKALLRISDLDVTEFQTLASLGIPMHVIGYNAKLLRDQAGVNMDYYTNSITLGGGESLDVILDASNTTLYPAGSVFYLYTPNLDHLSNDAENFGGLMTEVHIN
jgi:FtsP/CotA-like multicopper oxidase with cupredoxin domain